MAFQLMRAKWKMGSFSLTDCRENFNFNCAVVPLNSNYNLKIRTTNILLYFTLVLCQEHFIVCLKWQIPVHVPIQKKVKLTTVQQQHKLQSEVESATVSEHNLHEGRIFLQGCCIRLQNHFLFLFSLTVSIISCQHKDLWQMFK